MSFLTHIPKLNCIPKHSSSRSLDIPIPKLIDNYYFASLYVETKNKENELLSSLTCILSSSFLFPPCHINRRWVLQQLNQETSLPSSVAKGNLGTVPAERTQRILQEEMEVCGEAAGRYPSNYNAWSHRIWVLQNVAKLDLKVGLLFFPRG